MGLLVAARRQAYSLGWLASNRLPVTTLVVGNRIVGGAGKTPTTLALLAHLQQRGWRPGVLSRGYGASDQQAHPLLLDASSESRLEASQTGDEPLLIWRRTRAPVMIGRDRLANGRALLEAHPEINILLCDDGLQHLRLHRDIEVIVFDERGAGNGWLLPAGPLREPWQTPPTPGLVASPLVLYNAEKPSTPMAGYLVKRHTTLPVPLDDWWSGRASNDVLHPRDRRNTAVWAMAGMAQPQRFFDALSSTGFQVTPLPLADHADLSTLPWPHEVRDLIVTEKDAVKLVPSRVHTERPLTRVWVARLDFQPEDAFWSVLDQALAARMPPGGLPRQPC